MNLKKNYQTILSIIPKTEHKKLWNLLKKSVLFGILDLLSIAYLVPVILILLDRNKVLFFLKKSNVNLTISTFLFFGILILLLSFFIKNILQTKFNVKLYSFLYNLSHLLSMEIIENYLKNDFIHFQNQNKGNIIQNCTRLTHDFSVSLLASIITLFSEGIVFVLIIISLLVFNFQLTIVALISVFFYSYFIYKLKRKEILLINNTYKDSYSKANAELLNIIDGYIEIKNSENQDVFLNKYKKYNYSLNKVTSILTSSSSNYSKYLELFLIIGIAFLILYQLLLQTNAEHYTLLAILAALSIKILPSFSKILNSITMVKSHFYSIETLIKSKNNTKKNINYSQFNSSFQLKNVSFEYVKNDSILEKLNLTIFKGKLLAIKGHTGTGKTSLLHIIAGLIQPNSGTIDIDGTQIKPNYFCSFISYVSQQPFLFNGTLLQNITMHQKKEEIDFGYINFLLSNLELTDLINSLPNKIQTEISHNTSKLSGGQKQRLAIARALYCRPKLLILDEATNQQNEELEKKIIKFIKNIVSETNIAAILVSHNLANYDFCDLVYELKNKQLEII